MENSIVRRESITSGDSTQQFLASWTLESTFASIKRSLAMGMLCAEQRAQATAPSKHTLMAVIYTFATDTVGTTRAQIDVRTVHIQWRR